MTQDLAVLLTTAASIGLVHTLVGPDHYLPFVAMAKAGRWSLARTQTITLLCGIGHVLGSLALGVVGILFGLALGGLEWIEAVRGEVAAWLLVGFGLAYAAWGVRRAARARPHSHWHAHVDGTEHRHLHRHEAGHVHPHGLERGAAAARTTTPWVLFVIFVFGPCEALIPLLMYPAAEGSWWTVGLVALVFAAATVGTMLIVVSVGFLGLSRLPFGPLQRHAHTLAGLAVAACGLAILMGL